MNNSKFKKGLAGFDSALPITRLGYVSDGEVGRIERTIENLSENEIPSWLLNRRWDRETGEDLHLIGSEIDLQVKSDIDLMRTTSSWKGYRHSYELKVRGQKTRTTGRKRRAVGVKKKSYSRKG